MLSKIENGNISPSLASLQALSRALGIPLTTLFRGFEERRSASFVKSGEGLNIERRGTRAGHQYSLLGHIDDNSSGVMVEPYLITLTAESDVFPTFQHEGLEFLYMISGEVISQRVMWRLCCRAERRPFLPNAMTWNPASTRLQATSGADRASAKPMRTRFRPLPLSLRETSAKAIRSIVRLQG
jgi:transcriptional regulator with XRE-family HTH domain